MRKRQKARVKIYEFITLQSWISYVFWSPFVAIVREMFFQRVCYKEPSQC